MVLCLTHAPPELSLPATTSTRFIFEVVGELRICSCREMRQIWLKLDVICAAGGSLEVGQGEKLQLHDLISK